VYCAALFADSRSISLLAIDSYVVRVIDSQELFVESGKDSQMASHFDCIVIGTGQSGPALAARFSDAGYRVAVIERKLFGGTCVNTGCIPTKAMVASAYVAHLARRANEYGITVGGPVSVDMKRVKARKDEISAGSNRYVESWMRKLKNGTVYHGHARFEGPRAVRVGGELLEADRIFINVGGRAMKPPMPGLDQVPYLTNSSMMDLEVLPAHLLIVGGSYIGLEFGQMFRRFGAEVTIIEKGSRLIPREDEDVSQAVQRILETEGVNLRLNAECMTVKKRADRVVVALDCESGDREAEGSHLLLAVGRVPNTDDLGLDKAGVQVDARGYIQVDDQLRTNVSGIWALGDCNGRGAFTHTSYNDYEIVAANLLDNEPRKVSDRIVTYGLFIDPPLGRIGMTEAEVRKSGRKALIATRPMTKVGRAVEKGETQGFMKALVDADSKEILGATILGVGGDEAIHSLADVMYAKAPYTVVTHAVHIHPTVSELIPTMLGELKPLA
jgi:pyruvate/2-oxoglutarate dehydrogenase complex dihydrolipoamide dehydrogenase (E3) component